MKRKTCRALVGATVLLLGATLSLGADLGPDRSGTPGALLGKLPQRSPWSAPAAAGPGAGWVQYGIYCAGCHGASMRGRSVTAIQDASARYFSMRGLSSLSAAQLNAIALGQ